MRIFSLAAVLWIAGALAASAAVVAAPTPKAADSDSNSLLPGGNSKDPVSIEADQLVYSDKEGKATYSGNVILTQGATKLTCSKMVLFVDKANGGPGASPAPTPAPAAAGQPANSGSSVKHMDCSGPVTVVSKTQTATGDSAVYDKAKNRVWLIGNVTLSDGPNVTKGDKLTYNLTTSEANIENNVVNGKSGRVWSQFIPGSDTKGEEASASPSPAATPAKSPSKPGAAKSSPAKP